MAEEVQLSVKGNLERQEMGAACERRAYSLYIDHPGRGLGAM